MRVVADFVDVLRSHTQLRVDQALAGRMRFAHQIGDQRMHAGGGKQHGRVVLRHQRCARDHCMAPGFKKFQVGCADLGSGFTGHRIEEESQRSIGKAALFDYRRMICKYSGGMYLLYLYTMFK